MDPQDIEDDLAHEAARAVAESVKCPLDEIGWRP